MNAEFYVEILENHIPEIDEMLSDNWRLQQDNDPKYTSRLAKEFLRNNVLEVMDWPSNSPDLNPIENLWAIVKGNVERRLPKNLGELERFMAEEWRAIPETGNERLIKLPKKLLPSGTGTEDKEPAGFRSSCPFDQTVHRRAPQGS